MSIFNKKEIENAYTYLEENEENNIITKSTGTKKAITAFALTGLILGTSAAAVYHNCKTNNPTAETCIITELETRLFGYEAGLKHHYNDLLSTESDNYKLGKIEYSEPHTVYTLPAGYVLQGDEGVSRIQPIMNKRINEDGTVDVIYSLPEGYVLKKDENGNSYGERTVSPTKKDLNASVSYIKLYNDGSSYLETWSYEDDEITHEREAGPELILKR